MNPLLFIAVRKVAVRADDPSAARPPVASASSKGSLRRVAAGRRIPLLVSVVLLVAFVVDLRAQFGGARVTSIVDDLAQAVAAGAMSGAAAWRARRSLDRLRLSWTLIALGGASWAAGQTVWSAYEIFGSVETPFPSGADAGYLMLPVLAMAGLLVRPSQAFSGRGRVRVALDVLLVLVSLFVISWATALGEVYRGGADSRFARIVSLAYPAGDVALLTIVITVLAYAHAGSRSGLLCLGAGLGVFAVADSGFAYLTATDAYRTGNLIDGCWVAGFAIMSWAAILDRSSEPRVRRKNPYITIGLPCLPTLVGIGFAVWRLGPSGPDRLLLTVAGVMVVVVLVRQVLVVSDNYRLLEQMRYQAFHDPLTALSNRSLFNDRLAHALELHRRDRRPVSVLLIDLDNFKIVNDSLGHAVGDELLVAVSQALRSAVRAGDTVARFGGDEFAILVEDGGDVNEIAGRIRIELSRAVLVGERRLVIGASVGIARLDPSDPALSATEVLQRADIAMYAAKRAGKGMAREFTDEMAHAQTGQLDMQAALHADLRAGLIDVAYQPIYLADGVLQGIEALARWRYRDEAVSPELFLGLARDAGCIQLIDEIVLRKAATLMAPLGTAVLAVNLDARTLAHVGFVARVQRVLGETGLPPARLAVEVLEFDLIERDPAAMDALRALRELGIMIAVDDFGAGYATLARLRALRPDVLKIDRSLVSGSEDPVIATLLTGAAQLGRHIGAAVIAEGIENRGQLDAAISAGCDAVQGYYLSRPLDAGALVELVTAEAHGPMLATGAG
jgi:diguanylate cyclase (GGDEF)-like protein